MATALTQVFDNDTANVTNQNTLNQREQAEKGSQTPFALLVQGLYATNCGVS